MTEMIKPHYKNWLAFVHIISAAIENKEMPNPLYIIEKFNRYVLSEKPDEYKWGLHPCLYHQLYVMFDHLNVPLDEDEKKAKEEFFNPENKFKMRWDERRWGKDKK